MGKAFLEFLTEIIKLFGGVKNPNSLFLIIGLFCILGVFGYIILNQSTEKKVAQQVGQSENQNNNQQVIIVNPPQPPPIPDKPNHKGKGTEQQSTDKEKSEINELLDRVRVAYHKREPELMAACFLNVFDAKAAIKQWELPRTPSDINFKLDEPFIGSTGKDFMTLEVTLLQEKGGELHSHAVRKIKFEKRDGEWKIASANLFQ